jgi:hypothetical protein
MHSAKSNSRQLLISIFCVLWGIYLIYVGYEAAAYHNWPSHMGPTLNVYLSLFKPFDHPMDSYLAGAFLIIIGAVFVTVPLCFQYSALVNRRREHTKLPKTDSSLNQDS